MYCPSLTSLKSLSSLYFSSIITPIELIWTATILPWCSVSASAENYFSMKLKTKATHSSLEKNHGTVSCWTPRLNACPALSSFNSFLYTWLESGWTCSKASCAAPILRISHWSAFWERGLFWNTEVYSDVLRRKKWPIWVVSLYL